MSDDWLPELMLLSEYDGDPNAYLEALHDAFVEDFVVSKPKWLDKRVGLKRHPEYNGKSATFWHMITEGSSEADRTLDMRRCERIRWPKHFMEEHDGLPPHKSKARLVWWAEPRRGETRYLLALSDFSYVAVVADRGDFVLPWTAFYVEQEHRRRKFRRRYEEFWEARKG